MLVLLSLLMPPLLWSTSNLIDKFLTSEQGMNRVILLLFVSSVVGIATTPILILFGAAPWNLSRHELLMTALSGAIIIAGTFPYLLSMQRTNPIILLLIFQTIPVFNHGYSAWLLGEQLSIVQWIGIACVMLSSLVAAEVHKHWRTPVALTGPFYALISALLFASSAALFRSGSESPMSYLDGACASQIGTAVMCVPFALFRRARLVLRSSLPRMTGRFLYLNVCNELFTQAANVWVRYATYTCAVSIVVPTTQTLQSLYGFVGVVILPRVVPRLKPLFKQDTNVATLAASVILGGAGIFLLYQA